MDENKLIPVASKVCSNCQQEKPPESFARCRRSADRLQPWCRDCQRGYHASYRKDLRPELNSKAQRQWNTGVLWARFIKRRFGITPEDYNRLLEAQGGVCAICKRHPPHKRVKRLCVDHDHNTGRIRGLLCSRCNSGIGMLQDDEASLSGAIAYLTGRTAEPQPFTFIA